MGTIAVLDQGMTTRTRIKVCGITRVEDAMAAVECGVDALGLVFYARSPRAVNVAAAKNIVSILPPFVTVVALFVDPPTDEVFALLSQIHVDVLQFHGREPPDFCGAFGRPYIKAIPMRPGVDLMSYARDYIMARGLLVDAYHPAIPGGTGETFDWDVLPSRPTFPLILAGGLHSGNVATAIRRVRPYAVDVSSGVEVASGIKDPALMAAFVQSVWQA